MLKYEFVLLIIDNVRTFRLIFSLKIPFQDRPRLLGPSRAWSQAFTVSMSTLSAIQLMVACPLVRTRSILVLSQFFRVLFCIARLISMISESSGMWVNLIAKVFNCRTSLQPCRKRARCTGGRRAPPRRWPRKHHRRWWWYALKITFLC